MHVRTNGYIRSRHGVQVLNTILYYSKENEDPLLIYIILPSVMGMDSLIGAM
jgi:hypothetical protein